IVTVQDAIPDSAFYNCDLIEKIEIPETVTSIGSYAFYNCSKLNQLNSTTIGEAILPTGVTNIKSYVFYSCSEIEKVKFGDVTYIGSYAFYNCVNIEYFYGDTQYKLELPECCTSISDYAFYNLKLMTEVVVPDRVTEIGKFAFYGMNILESITIPFIGRNLTTTNRIESVFGYIFGYIDVGSSSYKTSDSDSTYQGYYASAPNHFYCYYIPKSLRNVSVTVQDTIPDYAFYNCDLIEQIYLVDCIESVGTNAFYNCNATINYTITPTKSSVWDGIHIADAYHGGTGTESDPYQIFKPKEFVYFINQVNSGVDYSNVYFMVTSDLDFGSKQIDLIASTEEKAFNGILDGNKHEIRNYVLNATYNTFNGLFGYVSGTIKNIGFKNNLTISTTSTDDIYNGMIVGKLSGRLENVYATGTLNVSTSKLGYTGGLVGYNEGVILNCYSDIEINDTSSENKAYAAGLVGYNAGTISGSIAYGNVSAKGYVEKFSYASGLVAFDNEGTVLNSFRYEGQKIMNFDVESESYNSQGESSSLEEIMSYCSENWDNTIWKFDSTRPFFL
ncbi:MAG: leucine-rich repeat domain-containing protein, partial [Anaeroplasma sp.]|uniref:leucine-rich repeat domain-containing protein n=1 Tax=Anaeroplasma sp. TaxID=1872523 RepID=UPI002A90EAD5